jgi:hypothetical protein
MNMAALVRRAGGAETFERLLVVHADAGGDTVADEAEVFDIAGNCATMRYDDSRFIPCEGDQIRT